MELLALRGFNAKPDHAKLFRVYLLGFKVSRVFITMYFVSRSIEPSLACSPTISPIAKSRVLASGLIQDFPFNRAEKIFLLTPNNFDPFVTVSGK